MPESLILESELVIIDRQSGLMWTRDGNIAGKSMTWHQAMEWAKNLDYGGYDDWRLPTIGELWSFIEKPREHLQGTAEESHHYAWFNGNGFKNVQPEWYWSGTTDGTDITHGVDMVDTRGPCDGNGHKEDHGFAWPVRG